MAVVAALSLGWGLSQASSRRSNNNTTVTTMAPSVTSPTAITNIPTGMCQQKKIDDDDDDECDYFTYPVVCCFTLVASSTTLPPTGTTPNNNIFDAPHVQMTDHPSPAPSATLSNNNSATVTPSWFPSVWPTKTPSHAPTSPPTTVDPTAFQPTNKPSLRPTTVAPTLRPTTGPTTNNAMTAGTTTFLVIGDVPYNNQQAAELLVQMDSIVAGTADFIVHVGDIRSAQDNTRCTLQEYEAVAAILQRSAVPMFIIPGDNEWNDCPNRAQAWEYWLATFANYEGRHWSHAFDIARMPDRPETFSFVWRGTLFVGLNLVGGTVHNATEWTTRLTAQVEWLQSLLRQHRRPTVVFGHANPINNHVAFFQPLQAFLTDELQNSIPLLYVNGDKHR